ncbi:MAG: hypothetical protein OHK0038_02240 [Flammeovirgaceae bacterium]
MNMKKLIVLVISSIVLLTLTACPDFESHCSSEIYDFRIPVNIIVPKDTLNVGDTIWFESSFSSTVKAYLSSTTDTTHGRKDIYFPNGIVSITTLPIEYLPPKEGQSSNLIAVYSAFEKVSKIENSKSTYEHLYYQYDKEKEEYRLKIGYVAKKKGEYYIAFGGDGINQEGVDCDDFKALTVYLASVSSNHNLFDALNQKHQNKGEYPINQHHFGFVVK